MAIGVRQLRAGLAGFVRRAAAGESIVVTVSGRPAAVLGPVGPGGTLTLDDLVAAGAVVGPRARRHRADVERERLPVDARSDVELRRIR
jgi:prevent-host-death family protein